MGASGSTAVRMVNSQVREFEEQRKADLDTKRDQLKARSPAVITYHYENGVLTCPQCGRSFAAKIGYISHLRAMSAKTPARSRLVVTMAEIGGGTQTGQPLCVNHQSSDEPVTNEQHNKITPEMIVDSLRDLSFWYDSVPFKIILKHVKDRFPVNQNLNELEKELRTKLRVAEKAGLVTSDTCDRWRPRTGLERLRQIPETLITLFWQLQRDTTNPLCNKTKRKRSIKIQKQEDSDSETLPSDG